MPRSKIWLCLMVGAKYCPELAGWGVCYGLVTQDPLCSGITPGLALAGGSFGPQDVPKGCVALLTRS